MDTPVRDAADVSLTDTPASGLAPTIRLGSVTALISAVSATNRDSAAFTASRDGQPAGK
jgi:hypothetical protein